MEHQKGLEEIDVEFFEEPDMKNFILTRKIRREDLHLVEELSRFPKDLILEQLQNIFNTYKERSAEHLTNIVGLPMDEQRRKLLELALAFVKRYDWGTAWHLVRLLEDKRAPIPTRIK